MSDEIDSRYIGCERILLICNKCGALFNTKNMEYIGARNIFWGALTPESILKGMECDRLGHDFKDLRLLNDEEFEKYYPEFKLRDSR